MADESRIKKSAKDRRYYQRHRQRILERKRAAYAADPDTHRNRVYEARRIYGR